MRAASRVNQRNLLNNVARYCYDATRHNIGATSTIMNGHLISRNVCNTSILPKFYKDTCSDSRSFSSVKNPDMFCRQCEQTSSHYACTTVGVCGKTSETSAAQDALVAIIRSVSHWMVQAAKANASPELLHPIHRWTLQAAFSTLTNVNFSTERVIEYCLQGEAYKKQLQDSLQQNIKIDSSSMNPNAYNINLHEKSIEDIEEFGLTVSILKRQQEMNHVDAFSLNEIATYGLKGVCAYAMHCEQLLVSAGGVSHDILNEIQSLWSQLDSKVGDMDAMLSAVLKVGELNLKVLELLDQAHVDSFGIPEPTNIRTTAVKGKCILVSGHDLKDLYALCQQTIGTGINIYTHGEMLPAHTYPEFRKFPHLVGNYGTAWQNQRFEFASFPGPILVTTNCILEPRRIYRNRLYTMNEVGVDGVKHIGSDRNYQPVIEHALQEKGFPETIQPSNYHLAGFNHRTIMNQFAGQVIDAIKNQHLSRIFLIGGCDGTQWDRSYFTDIAEATPSGSMILTLGCAKNRIIRNEKLLNNPTIPGTSLPRVLDMGQCNDSYSAIVVAVELMKAFKLNSVNDLPLSLAISHLEQKAVAVFCTLLYLDIKNIRLGPSLPTYITPNVLKVLQNKYNIMSTDNAHPENDVELMMNGM